MLRMRGEQTVLWLKKLTMSTRLSGEKDLTTSNTNVFWMPRLELLGWPPGWAVVG